MVARRLLFVLGAVKGGEEQRSSPPFLAFPCTGHAPESGRTQQGGREGRGDKDSQAYRNRRVCARDADADGDAALWQRGSTAPDSDEATRCTVLWQSGLRKRKGKYRQTQGVFAGEEHEGSENGLVVGLCFAVCVYRKPRVPHPIASPPPPFLALFTPE